MLGASHSQIARTIPVLIGACFFAFPAQAKYSGGTGEPNDPYQIATAADLIALGETPADYDKHFILTADIDLDPNLPGRKVFNKAVIAPDANEVTSWFEGTAFTGVFDGGGHTISHLTITGVGYLGLFGAVGEVKNLGVVDVKVIGSGRYVGGLVGRNVGRVTRCYSTGVVSGNWGVGGLVGQNGGVVTQCYSTAAVSGKDRVAGLVGSGYQGTVTQCYSTGAVKGSGEIGGLVVASGPNVLHCVWDTNTSGLLGSEGGAGLTTAEMMDPYMLGLNGFANDPNWVLDAGHDYPRLAWEGTRGQTIPEPRMDWLPGHGTAEDPYRIDTADQLVLIGKASGLWGRHFVLGADIELDPNLGKAPVFGQAVIPSFAGAFDGRGRTISHLTMQGGSYLGLFGQLVYGAEVKNLGVIDVNIAGSGASVGGLVGRNGGSVTQCHTTGVVSGNWGVGGLVGYNYEGAVTQCYTTGAVKGGNEVGGLVGFNGYETYVTLCYSTGVVTGRSGVGGLVGDNDGGVTRCYSMGAVDGINYVGGLVGQMEPGDEGGSVAECYSVGRVSATGNWVGGLVGGQRPLYVTGSFWDMQTSGQTTSANGTGKSTAEMQDPKTFMAAGWNFANEPDGPDDIWAEPTDGGFPVLYWQLPDKVGLPRFSGGTGEPNDPYRISTVNDLNSIGHNPRLMKCHFQMVADLDLAGLLFYPIGDDEYPFGGVFDGNGHTISHLTIKGESYVGPFGEMESGGEVRDLGVTDVNVVGSGYNVGGLVGYNYEGFVTQCYTTGAVKGRYYVGGLVGDNDGQVTQCYSAGRVSGAGWFVGGLVEWNQGDVTGCFWDTQTSGRTWSAGGTAKTTAQMQAAKTFLDAGWDFVGETKNGTEDIWWINEGKDYPRLWWELIPAN